MDMKILDFVQIPVAVLDRGPDGLFRYSRMNDAARTMSGLADADIVGRLPTQVFPGRAGITLERNQRAAAEGGVPYSYSYTLDLPSGEKTIDSRIFPVRDDAGVVTRLVANMIDRTAEHRLREERAHSDAHLVAMQGEIERFISMAAHDLRSPMRNVQSITEMLREDFVDHGDGKLDLIEMLEEVAIKASGLIADVLAYARATDVRESRDTFDLGALCRDIFTILDPANGHDLTSASTFVMTDRTALQIVLRNLVDNALKHAERAPVSLHIATACVTDQPGKVAFVVSDDGRGFDDPGVAFLDGGEFRYESGFGLLGIKRLIASRGGSIRAVPPISGRGAEIHFTLPGTVFREVSASAPDAA